ncbi:MAG TPA: ATP-binding cassette domain-containing protein [Spirochaetota bacterium]|nr:ATP-binding cassette domain-containing protein [Spirochaetota bacterium]
MKVENTSHHFLVRDLEYAYSGNFRLQVPHLVIDRGQSLGISGPNGCGKSTLLRLLAFLETPQAGSIELVQAAGGDTKRLHHRITLLLQDHYLLKRSVFENVAYGLRVRGDRENLRDRVFRALQDSGLDPERFAGRKWHELSGGEARRVSLAARLILKPEALLLDEPVANIDRESALLIKDVINTLKERDNMTMIISSHDQTWLAGVTDSIIQMRDGKITGLLYENSLQGPWHPDIDGLWAMDIQDAGKIYASKPPAPYSRGILDPANIIIATREQADLSAQNLLRGTVESMEQIHYTDSISVKVKTGTTHFTCTVTHHAAENLHIFPGKTVWLIFKASSIIWE